jgi:hypothetical protein
MKTAERRAYRRFNVDPLLCRTNPHMDGVCVLRNVSLKGAFFMTPEPPKIGSKLELEFREEPLEGYCLEGLVVRAEEGRVRGFGIEFEGPHPRILRAVYCSDGVN